MSFQTDLRAAFDSLCENIEGGTLTAGDVLHEAWDEMVLTDDIRHGYIVELGLQHTTLKSPPAGEDLTTASLEHAVLVEYGEQFLQAWAKAWDKQQRLLRDARDYTRAMRDELLALDDINRLDYRALMDLRSTVAGYHEVLVDLMNHNYGL